MPKYKIWFDVGLRNLKSVGTVVYQDDEAAIADFRGWSQKRILAELHRPDRNRPLARVHPDGSFERLADPS